MHTIIIVSSLYNYKVSYTDRDKINSVTVNSLDFLDRDLDI